MTFPTNLSEINPILVKFFFQGVQEERVVLIVVDSHLALIISRWCKIQVNFHGFSKRSITYVNCLSIQKLNH